MRRYYIVIRVSIRSYSTSAFSLLTAHCSLLTAHCSLALIRLHQVSIDEDAVLHRPQAGEEELPFLLDGHVVFFVDADSQFVALGETQREHAKVFDGRLAIDTNL